MAVTDKVQRSLGKTFAELRRALSTRTTFSLALFASVYVVGEGLFDPLIAEMFVQKLGWSVEAYSSMAGISGVTTNVLGAMLGGLLSDRFGRRRICTLAMLTTSAVFFIYTLTSAWWEVGGYPHYLLYPLFKGLVAMTSVSFFSLAMKVSWTKAAATQFTLYMALGNVGYAVGAKLNTWLVVVFGATPSYEQFFLVSAILPLLPIVLLTGMNPDRIARQRRAEAEQ
jgi:PAT family beta-lactamase induction signal transducer AmpG